MTGEEALDKLRSALAEVNAERDPDSLLSSFVVVYETLDPDGGHGLGAVMSEGLTPWAAQGMLGWGNELVMPGFEDDDE